MIGLDVKYLSKGLLETLRERLAELEDLEAAGAATPDTFEMLVELHEMLDELDRKMSKHAGKTTH